MNTESVNPTPTLSSPSTPSTPSTIDAGTNATTTATNNPFDDSNARAYESTAAERAALEPGELIAINIDPDELVATVMTTISQLDKIRADIAALVPAGVASRFARLKEYTQALARAQGIYTVVTQPMPELPALHDRANKSRLLLATDAYVLAQRGLVAQSVIDDLKGPVGYVNTSGDLNALVTLYELSWSTFESVTGIKKSDLDEARRLYGLLLAALTKRAEQASSLEVASDQRSRAYTVVLNAYDQARRAAMFVRWDHGDADTYVPSLWAGRGARPKKDQPKPPAPTSTPVPAPKATATAPAPAVEATEPVDHDMPGGSPFVHN